MSIAGRLNGQMVNMQNIARGSGTRGIAMVYTIRNALRAPELLQAVGAAAPPPVKPINL
jgi:hypothetical protein